VVKKVLAKLKALSVWAWSFFGDSRTKNCLLFILMLMTMFGIVAPETATSLRDTIIALAF
jgi:hypothetical protein